jgi:Flp pilus assembly protein TadB
MATLAIIVGGAVVNALAFSGSNYLFSKMSRQEGEEEKKRHDIAAEKLAQAEQDYEKSRIERLDFINDKLMLACHAQRTFSNVDDAIKEYYLVTGQDMTIPQPKLSDYYQPSQQQRKGEIMFVLVGMTLVYFTGVFIAKRK